jgi:hypothetical protein
MELLPVLRYGRGWPGKDRSLIWPRSHLQVTAHAFVAPSFRLVSELTIQWIYPLSAFSRTAHTVGAPSFRGPPLFTRTHHAVGAPSPASHHQPGSLGPVPESCTGDTGFKLSCPSPTSGCPILSRVLRKGGIPYRSLNQI